MKGMSPKLRRALILDLAVLLLICGVCLIVFFSFYTSSIVSQTEETRLGTMETALDFAVDSTDTLFDICVGQPLEQIHDTLSITAISFSSSEYHIDGGALARAKSDLNAMVVNSPIIANAFLYVPNANLVISSSYSSGNLSSSIYYNIIWTYEGDLAHLTSLNLCGGTASIFNYGSEYIIVRDMYVTANHKQSTLFLVLDTDELNRYIKTSIKNENIRIFLYDSFGNQLQSTDPNDLNDLFDPSTLQVEGEKIIPTKDGLYILNRESEVTSFHYYLTVDEASVRPSFLSILPTVIPFAFLLFFLVCLIAVFAGITLYKPFVNVVTKLEASDITLPEDTHTRNQFDYLNSAISSIVDRQEHLQSMLQFVSHDVQTRLLHNLLSGGAIGNDNIASTLESINSPFKLNAVYAVAVIECRGETETEQESIAEVYGRVSGYMTSCSVKHNLSFELVQTNPNLLALVIQFNDFNLSVVNGKHIIFSLKHEIMGMLELKKRDVVFEVGNLYHSILDIGLSYKEALNAIEVENIPVPAENVSVKQVESGGSENSLTTLLGHRVEQIVVSCQQDEENTVPHLIALTMDEIKDATSDCSQLFQIIKEFLNIYVNQIVSCDYINTSMIPDVYSEFCEFAVECMEPELMIKHSEEAAQKLTVAFMEQLKKQKNPYIVATQEFIKDHYSEPELSLDDIAANVRISSSYLSKLFSNSLGMKLFEYLTHYRVEASMELLLNTRKTVAEIAELTGFSSSRNYIRAFKRYYNETPGEYRKSHGVK